MRETRGVETRTLPVTSTDSELLERGDQLARAHQAVTDEEARQKTEKERMKDALGELEGAVRRLARVVRDKTEPRDVECRIVHDYAANSVQVVRTDTGEVVSARHDRPRAADRAADARRAVGVQQTARRWEERPGHERKHRWPTGYLTVWPMSPGTSASRRPRSSSRPSEPIASAWTWR